MRILGYDNPRIQQSQDLGSQDLRILGSQDPVPGLKFCRDYDDNDGDGCDDDDNESRNLKR